MDAVVQGVLAREDWRKQSFTPAGQPLRLTVAVPEVHVDELRERWRAREWPVEIVGEDTQGTAPGPSVITVRLLRQDPDTIEFAVDWASRSGGRSAGLETWTASRSIGRWDADCTSIMYVCR